MKTVILLAFIGLTVGACVNGNALPIVAAGVVGAVVATEVIDHNRHRHCHWSEGQQRRVCHWS